MTAGYLGIDPELRRLSRAGAFGIDGYVGNTPLIRLRRLSSCPVITCNSSATYIDSAGVAAFFLARQEVEAYGGKFFLSGLQETLRSIFETSRLDRIFRIFPDVDAARAATGT